MINQGKMAVVLEIEISELFGCRGWETPTCDKAQVDRELDEMYRLGVRSSLLLNKFDNPLAGVRFDGGADRRRDQRRQPRERRLVLERRDLHRARYRDNKIETFDPERQRVPRRRARDARGRRRDDPDLPAGAALQHPRPHRARPPPRCGG